MAEKLRFELVSPERLLLSEEVEMVVVPGSEGNFGALPKHAPLLSLVRPGVIDVYATRQGPVSERLFVAGGYAEVTPERCTVLAEAATPLSEIDRGKVEAELKDLREDLDDSKDDAEKKLVMAKIALAEAKLKAIGT
ncbi:MAG TPA: F0F1 ATP synthase subunit epsilon [Alphaproteobacteria bacterium]|nr:F0F1 ATP synthase subunit epsilon [Alphaproteobacteria bacterium]